MSNKENLYPLFVLKFKYVVSKYGKTIDDRGLMDINDFYTTFFPGVYGELVADVKTALKYYTNTIMQCQSKGLVNVFYEGRCKSCGNINQISFNNRLEEVCIKDTCGQKVFESWTRKDYKILFCISQRGLGEN